MHTMSSNCSRLFRAATLTLMVGCAVLYGARAPAQPRYVDDAVKVARELINSNNIFDRLTAAATLVDIGDRKALKLLLEMAQSSDFIIQRSAIDTLLGIQHPDGLDTIYRMASEDLSFRSFLIESLASRPRSDMGEFLVSVLSTEDAPPRIRKFALQALISSDEVPGLFERISAIANDDHTGSETRAYAYYVMTDLGHGAEVLSRLLEIVEVGTGGEQEAAAVALGLIDTEQSKLALGKLRESSDERVVLAALASDAGLGNDDSVSRMVQLIAYGKPMEATVVAGSLKRLPPGTASQITKVILDCCKLKSDIAARVLESWGWIEWDASMVYAWGLAHENADVRLQALWLVGQRRDRGMLATVASFLDDSDAALRGMAAWTIVHIAGDSYSGELETSLAEAL